jgi:arylsulfatase A-like enzyme
MPTFAELAGTSPVKDTDGISFLPELLGERVAGHKQEQHPYLYWEITRHTAVRIGDWKAVRVGADSPWELYNLATDIGEKNNVAEKNPEIVAKVKAIVQEAHRPMATGEIYDRKLLEKDRNYLGSEEATTAFRKKNKG